MYNFPPLYPIYPRNPRDSSIFSFRPILFSIRLHDPQLNRIRFENSRRTRDTRKTGMGARLTNGGRNFPSFLARDPHFINVEAYFTDPWLSRLAISAESHLRDVTSPPISPALMSRYSSYNEGTIKRRNCYRGRGLSFPPPPPLPPPPSNLSSRRLGRVIEWTKPAELPVKLVNVIKHQEACLTGMQIETIKGATPENLVDE